MTADEFEQELYVHATPYVRIDDLFIFPVKCPEMRWIYELDVNVTGAAFADKPIKIGGRYEGCVTVMRW
jgi:hypothetical protein